MAREDAQARMKRLQEEAEKAKEKENSVTETAKPEPKQEKKPAAKPQKTSATKKTGSETGKAKTGRKPGREKGQLTLTIKIDAIKQLEDAAGEDGLSAQKFVSRYVEKHLDDIISYISDIAGKF